MVPTALEAVSELSREREVFKYEPFLTSECQYNFSGRPLPSSKLSTARDGVMTALAQLGTYQTKTERALICLFDATYQYFIAEATPLIPLTGALSSDACPVPLIHCGTAIPRRHGICEMALSTFGNPPAKQLNGSEEPSFGVVSDLTSDDRVTSRPFCGFSDAYRFYAVVPVRTRTGIDIGTYCVLNPTKPADWDEKCMQHLRDVSTAIMEHLVARRSKHAWRRNERVNRGLGSLIERRATVSGWQFGPNAAAYGDHKAEGMLYPQQRLERQARENKAQTETMPVASPESGDGPPDISSANMHDMSPATPNMFDLESAQSPKLAPLQGSNSVDEFEAEGTTDFEDDDITKIFSRAANIIRESFEVAGCLFLDVTHGSYRASTPQSPLGDNHTGREVSAGSSASGSDDQSTRRSAESRDCPSDILGFSTSEASSLSRDELPDTERVITKKFLAQLLRRYPDGKIFSFDADGELLPSDYSDEDYRSKSKSTTSPDGTDDGSTQVDSVAQKEQTNSHSSRPTEISLLCKAFPAARSVAFVPIWDAKRERWLAGGFMYTLTPARVFSIEAELSLFKAFSKIITSDVHNLEARQVAKAQADTLGSLSHELRSPLHGIMFSTELLDKNDLSVFQSNATHTIETCCRTLLDTINHLLDFSKVNSFGLKQQNNSHDKPFKTRKRVPKNLAHEKALHMHVRLDGLVEEVVNSIFAGFNFQYMSIRQLSRSDKSLWTDSAAHNRLDGAQAMEQLDLNAEDKGAHKIRFGAVSVYMYIDPTCDWMFHLQAGALRRIVMNLFGNSLKYTDTGFICVTLKQETTVTKRGKSEGVVKLVVRDTGKGIGKDYLTHKLFKPFAQEDELASGTGLGLSIVKATVSQLGGRIQVESKPGVGTTITVKLPLVPSSNITDTVEISDEDQAFNESVKELKGMRVKMVGFDPQGIEGVDDGRGVIRDICRRWLYLDVLTEEQAEHMTPDLVLWLDDALQSTSFSPEQLAKTPNIVICKDPLVAYQRFKLQAGSGQEGIFEYITQPVGPRKLAKSMQHAFERWMGLPKLEIQPRRPALARSLSSGSIGTRPAATTMDAVPPLSPTLDRPRLEGISEHTQPLVGEKEEAQPKSMEPTEPTEPAESTEPVRRLTGHKILLVDDNHINLKVLKAYMTKLGRAFETATNGQEAVDVFTQNPGQFAGILMDISMPVMDGLEASRRIRAFERQHKLESAAIVVLTGLATQTAQQHAYESGVDNFLTKPVSLKALRGAMVSRALLSMSHDE